MIYIKEGSDLGLVNDIITKYKEAPIKAFLSETNVAEAANFNAQSFNNAGDVLNHFNAQHATLSELITKVFKSFDKDNSGFIDLVELKDVSTELGHTLDTAELEECMKDLDLNKDGKISLEEFTIWWLSGRQGLTGWMR